MKKTTIVLLRHGQSKKNVKGINGGVGESLTALGISQAKEAAIKMIPLFSGEDLCIFASTSVHTIETANILGDVLNAPVEKPVDFFRLNLGIVDGLSEQEINKQYPDIYENLSLWRKGLIDIKALSIPKMESYQMFWERGIKLLETFPKDKNIILVCSNSLMILLTHILLGNNPATTNKYRHISIPNCGIIAFDNIDNKYIVNRSITNVPLNNQQ